MTEDEGQSAGYIGVSPLCSKSSLGNFQYHYLPELSVNVYSYRLIIKSMPYCCVHGSMAFLKSHIITNNNVTLLSLSTIVLNSRDR